MIWNSLTNQHAARLLLVAFSLGFNPVQASAGELLGSSFSAAESRQIERPEIRVNLKDEATVDELSLAERAIPQVANRSFDDLMKRAQQQCLSRHYDEAMELLEEGLAILLKHLSPTDTRVAKCRMRLGSVQFLNRNFNEAVHHLRLAANGYERHELYNQNCMTVYHLLGESYYELFNLRDAEKYAWKALSIAADQKVSDSVSRQEIMRLHFKSVLAQNDPAKVLRTSDDHLKLLSFVSTAPVSGCKNPQKAYECFVRDNRFWALLSLRQIKEAEQEMKRALPLNEGLNDHYGEILTKSLVKFGKTNDYVDGCVEENGMVWSADRMPIKLFIDDSFVAPEFAAVIPRLTAQSLAKWNDATGGALKYSWVRNKDDANMIITFKKLFKPDGALARTCSQPIFHPQLVPDVLNTRITIDLFLQETPIPSTLSSYGRPCPAYQDADAFEALRERSISPRAESELAAVILHEMGHALGLRHSSDPRDLMYFTHFCISDLSKRDKETAKIWYGYRAKPIQDAKDELARTRSLASVKNLHAHPNDYFCLTECGRAALTLRNTTEARRYLLQAIEIAPKNPSAYFQLGLVDMSVNHYEDAIAKFKKAQSCDSRFASADIFANLATCEFNLKKFRAACDYSDLALRKQPSFQRLHRMYASALFEQRRFKKALSEITRFLAIYPSSEEGYLLEGKILSELHDYSASIKAFEKSLSLNPNNKVARQQRDSAALHLHEHLQSSNSQASLKS